MVTWVGVLTALVVMLNVALATFAGTVTVDCTWAAALLLDRFTNTPPAGAALLSVTVPVEPCPLVMVAGSTPMACNAAVGVTVMFVVWVTPFAVAEMVTGVEVVTALVVMLKVALVALARTVTGDDTCAAALLLDRLTDMPPLG